MKTVIVLWLMLSSMALWAQGLNPDFSCVTQNMDGESFEIKIVDIDFAKEVSIVKENKVCGLRITRADYKERAVLPVMMVDFVSQTSCFSSKNFKIVPRGFLKVNIKGNEAYVMALYDHQTLPCTIKHFNKKKLRDRIRSAF